MSKPWPEAVTAEVEVSVTDAPNGRPAVLLQLPDAYLLLLDPMQVMALASLLEHAAARLGQVLAAEQS